jgi:hypothetical protein
MACLRGLGIAHFQPLRGWGDLFQSEQASLAVFAKLCRGHFFVSAVHFDQALPGALPTLDAMNAAKTYSLATGPLAGHKVLELGQLIAGPFAAKTLADFGADVVKIEPPGAGDPLRQWRLMKDGTSVWWQVQSRNKQT